MTLYLAEFYNVLSTKIFKAEIKYFKVAQIKTVSSTFQDVDFDGS